MNLSITPELQQFIQRKIDSGMYSNASEVVRDALRRMDDKDDWKDLMQFLSSRITDAESGNYTSESFDSVIDQAKDS
jgi:antitoxin ParD1/3/4